MIYDWGSGLVQENLPNMPTMLEAGKEKKKKNPQAN